MNRKMVLLSVIFSFIIPAAIEAQPRIRVVTPFVSVDATVPLWVFHTAVRHHDVYVEEDYGYYHAEHSHHDEHDCGDGDEHWAPVPEENDEIRHNADHMFADLEAEVELHNQPAMEPAMAPDLEAFEQEEAQIENCGTMEPEPMVPADAPSAHTGDGYFNRDMEIEILQLINAERADHGLEPLRANAQLREAARQHSQEMNELNYFSHESPVEAYETLPMRLRNAGVAKYGWAGENIAMSTAASAQRFVQMWMDSPGHRANILKPEFEFSGIGVYGSGHSFHATQVFSSSR